MGSLGFAAGQTAATLTVNCNPKATTTTSSSSLKAQSCLPAACIPSSSVDSNPRLAITHRTPLLLSSFVSRSLESRFFGDGASLLASMPMSFSGGGALGASMNIFERVVRIFKSYANALVSAAEDPEKILEQTVIEMNEDLVKLRQASAQVLASQKQLENKYNTAQKNADDWYRRAKLALQKGEENLAREALKRRKDYEVKTVQRTLIETWGLIRETYVDPSFNHQDWDSKLGETMSQILPVKTADAAYGKIQSMLATLGDPFTRLVSPQEYESFKIGSDGTLEGVGLLIASERETGRLVVISSLEGGPAARAGINSGDELVQIDDETLLGMDGDKAASKLRGPAGTPVKLKVRKEGVAKAQGITDLTEVKIVRENITLTPVFAAVIPHTAPDGHLAKLGYLRLTAFSQNAAADMEKAISGLENQGAESYILDLRNNPGGLVKAGLDVAKMWLDGNEVLVNTIDRDGNTLPISIMNGHALTHDPLAILVNGGSASASEILAGALHDNGRAVLIGSKTFGKGKIQSVTELRDGSALFVTVAKYLSPSLHEIDQVGIVPDVQCTTGDSGGGLAKSLFSGASSAIEQDSCVVTAEHQLGIF